MSLEEYATAMLEEVMKFYQDGKHLEEFERWKAEREEKKK